MPLWDLEETLREALSAAVAEYAQSSEGIQVGLPPRPELGDLATNAALIIAKRLGKPPMEIASSLAASLQSAKEIAAADALAPGFINVRFHDEILHQFADWFRSEQHKREGRIEPCDRAQVHSPLHPITPTQKIILEFVSANPTGPLNVVSARAGAAGDHLARLWLARGHKVDCEYYVNDVGGQIDSLVESVKNRFDTMVKHAFDVRGMEDFYNNSNLKEKIEFIKEDDRIKNILLFYDKNITSNNYYEYLKEFIGSFDKTNIPDNYYKGDYLAYVVYMLLVSDANVFLDNQRIKNTIVSAMLEEYIKPYLKMLGIYDINYYYQSSLKSKTGINPSYEEKVLAFYEKSGLLYEKDGAVWLRSTTLGDEQDWVMVRRDGGAETYLLADIAYHLDKARRGYDLAVNIWGPDHHAHVKRLQNALTPVLREEGFIGSEQQGSDFLKIIISQQVNLVDRSGETVKMSKRQGNLVTLHEVLAELGVDVTRYFFLDRSLSSHLDFNLELARQQTPENPIFRIQYATARIASLIRKAREQGEYAAGDTDWTHLESPAERNLLRLIAEIPRTARLAADSWEVHRIPATLLELAGEFHRWYDTHRILGIGDAGLTAARLALAESVRGALGWGLDLLGISTPESM